MASTGHDDAEACRPHLQGLAYRLLGSMVEAEDAVQDAYLRYAQQASDDIDNPRAWLATVVTNRCIDMLRAARRKREKYVGEWLPEPIATDPAGRPELLVERAEGLTLAFLTLLERLSPLERAAYLLHDIFDYSYSDISRILERNEAACRQLASRARRQIQAKKVAEKKFAPGQEETVARFVDAVQKADSHALLGLLKEDIILWNDGGGKAKAALNPIYGADKVSRFLIATSGKVPDGIEWQAHQINGEPGFVGRYPDGSPYAAMVLEIENRRIAAIRSIVNRDKLAGVS